MSAWTLVIHGAGCHGENPTDIEQLTAAFTRELIAARQRVDTATLTIGRSETIEPDSEEARIGRIMRQAVENTKELREQELAGEHIPPGLMEMRLREAKGGG